MIGSTNAFALLHTVKEYTKILINTKIDKIESYSGN
jgi:hypothetical protein